MARLRVASHPNTQTLIALLEDYKEMLHEAERAAKKIMALDSQTERFWEEVSDSAHLFTAVGSR